MISLRSFHWLPIFAVLAAIFSAETELSAQKKPGFDTPLFLKALDGWYVDCESVLTLKLRTTGESWEYLRSVETPLDAQTYNSGKIFGSLPPYYQLTVDFSTKPIRYITLSLNLDLLPDSRNRAFDFSVESLAETGLTIGYQNGSRSITGKIEIDIGGDFSLVSSYKNSTANATLYLTTNGLTFLSRGGIRTFGLGSPLDPNYNLDNQLLLGNDVEYRGNTFSFSFKNSKTLKIEPSVTLSFDFLEVVFTNFYNNNYDVRSVRNSELDDSGQVYPSFIQKKIRPNLDAKLTFRPIDELTLSIGGSFAPSFPGPHIAADDNATFALYKAYVANTWNAFLNVDFRLSKRILFQSGFSIKTREYRADWVNQTFRWIDDYELTGSRGRLYGMDRDLRQVSLFFSTQYR